MCRTIDRVLTAINSLRLRVINFPDDDELPFSKNDFAVLSRGFCYACKKYLLTPILNPRNAADRRYNQAHVLARNVVERTFGVWKKRFPCLAFGLRTKLQKTLKIIVATAVLHNLAVKHGELDLEGEIPNDDVPVDPPADDMTGNRWRQLIIDNHFTR
ncbi:hypothetical protein ANN_27895 [Periplaneta americana]|uniref:DDE Tnp4 domain-containing protein n=1 Tax=Periplaneta americana TaxID=6978 RepID=A0ABQ8RVE7_PERAM|nr:hypothetical protein ANN_27895 [Periplaneta americana]